MTRARTQLLGGASAYVVSEQAVDLSTWMPNGAAIISAVRALDAWDAAVEIRYVVREHYETVPAAEVRSLGVPVMLPYTLAGELGVHALPLFDASPPAAPSPARGLVHACVPFAGARYFVTTMSCEGREFLTFDGPEASFVVPLESARTAVLAMLAMAFAAAHALATDLHHWRTAGAAPLVS